MHCTENPLNTITHQRHQYFLTTKHTLHNLACYLIIEIVHSIIIIKHKRVYLLRFVLIAEYFPMVKILPTLGASAVVMALQLCDHVSLAGFGYDMQHPEARLHYYEGIRMDAMKAQVCLCSITARILYRLFFCLIYGWFKLSRWCMM